MVSGVAPAIESEFHVHPPFPSTKEDLGFPRQREISLASGKLNSFADKIVTSSSQWHPFLCNSLRLFPGSQRVHGPF